MTHKMYTMLKDSDKTQSTTKVSITKAWLKQAKMAIKMAGTARLGSVVDEKMVEVTAQDLRYLTDLMSRKKVQKYSIRVV